MNGRGDTAPRRHRMQIEGGPAFEIASDEDCLLRGALRAGVPFPYECSTGGCGTCRFELIEGRIESLWAEAPGLSERERKRGKLLACQSRPLTDCRIRARIDPQADVPIRADRIRATLLSRREITADMAEFSFRVPDAARFLAGQYALVHPPATPGPRVYSMSNIDTERGIWRFIVRRVAAGVGSTALFDRVRPGDQLRLDGPYGHAYLRDGERDLACVAGGSGLGPMLSVARRVLAEPGPRRVRFFLGLRSQADLGAAQELRSLVGPRLTVMTVLSAPEREPPWTGATGFVHALVESSLGPELARFDFYFAGPPPMIDAMQDLLIVRHRVPFDQVRFDRFV